jgi:beta-N-acetylhexosaminidase
LKRILIDLKLGLAIVVTMLLPWEALAAPPVHLDRNGERWAAVTLHKMTIEEKIGQMIMPWARIEFMNVNNPEYLQLREEMRKYHVGGFGVTVFVEGGSLLKSEPLEAAELTNSLQRDSKYPLLFAADFERGLSMRLNGTTDFPTAMAFGAAGDTKLASEFGRITAQEARAIGIQWNWFPVADVNSNPANPIINTRSFGEDPVQVGQMVAAYIEGARSEGMLTTAKHFPGHGDTDTDSHLTLARVNASLDRLNQVELIPFHAAIAAGVDSVMLAHITAPALEPDPDKPASISKAVVTGLLKGKLGFKGLVITDALDMGALTRVFSGTPSQVSGSEAVAAIEAGNDMVIIPGDLGGAYKGLLDAVKSGEITPQRINESVLKILRAKASVGLNRSRLVDMANVSKVIAIPDHQAVAQSVADHAVTLLADVNHRVPLAAKPASEGLTAVIFTDSASISDGVRLFVRQLRQRSPGATILYVNEANSSYIAPQVMAAVASARTVIALAEAVPIARRATPAQADGSVSLNEDAAQLLANIVKSAPDKTIVAAFGNPYVGSQLPGLEAYICTYSNTSTSAIGLAKALFGEIPIQGRTPVTIPGIAQRGAGINR